MKKYTEQKLSGVYVHLFPSQSTGGLSATVLELVKCATVS